ncbi:MULTISPECIES: molybdenum cofactor biosynthesis protein MoaE [unclassified Saccharibacter]|uniref:molybdenum cofactor biosynthesis protein MoaE n=1 Tax=unclassified Saccharibacter TaxID=2648722 RepID=UPI001321D0FB|nr:MULTISPECIES: molybdenum cofactor biosynthesis protein MoaE [unclassified Saccharibacter]MXV36649.1 molybdenum cofactor biosynthesis protein MoaE [Saccharibacter sp. EH611]MXV58791.1 molybdenum cofactor biosynthesis protein MoaE [Saccharibacter sp. EH70]MXV65597.1 molybdenum cofactor biosynthesis protein MoaE [Saccharibacter sp. EH60]
MAVRFVIAAQEMDITPLKQALHLAEAGGYCSFEGWVRNHNHGRVVQALEYQVYEALARKEGTAILEDAMARFEISAAAAMHRSGMLDIGDMAVWIGVSAPHREAAFQACRFIIDAIKERLPVWKKEHYIGGEAQWVACHHHG